MEILFTGSNGFVGSNIIDLFISNHNHVYTLSKKNSYYNIDLSTTIPILPIKFDLVIHAAGIAHIVSNTKDLNKYIYETNVNATKNLLKSLDSSHYPASFIFLSSVAVYGLEYGINIKEANILNGETAYAKSKITCENLIIDWCNKNNVTCTVLRLPLLVGKDPKGNLESLIKSPTLIDFSFLCFELVSTRDHPDCMV
jgi:nucleoside-diphosphate-sugar epimerase